MAQVQYAHKGYTTISSE